MKASSNFRLPTILMLVALIGIGMFLVLYSTVWGAGLISDTFQYMASAKNFAVGNGFSIPYGDGELEPMTKYPPMFSIVLSIFELIGVRSLVAARYVNIVLFGINIYLVFLCTWKLTHSQAFSLFTSMLFSTSFVMLEVHSWALSEPLYIGLGLSAILTFQIYLEEEKTSWLFLSSVLVSFAFLTRYVGLSLVLTFGTILLLNHRARRLKDLLFFGGIATLPMLVWTLRGYLLTDTLNDRMLSFHPLTVKNYVSAIDVMYGWFIPSSIVQGEEKTFLILTVIALIVASLFLEKFYRAAFFTWIKGNIPQKWIVLLHLLYVVFYLFMIVISKTWVDPDIGLSDRILSPILVSLLVLLAAGLAALWNAFNGTRIIVVLVGLVLTLYYVAGTAVLAQGFHQSGIGIARRGWNRSEVIQSLHSYSAFTVYTNSNSTLYLWSDRAGYTIPEFETLKQTGTDTKVLLVIFHHVPPKGKRLNELINGLELLNEDNIVSVYALAP